MVMLNAVIDYLPSPLDVKPIVGHRAENPDEEEDVNVPEYTRKKVNLPT
jgi:translation elongation factor EF-G